MGAVFDAILNETTEMFDIAARMAEEEAMERGREDEVLTGLIELARSCRRLMIEAKKRAEEVGR